MQQPACRFVPWTSCMPSSVSEAGHTAEALTAKDSANDFARRGREGEKKGFLPLLLPTLLLLLSPCPALVHSSRLSCGRCLHGHQQHPETSVFIFTLHFTFYPVLCTIGDQEGDNARHKSGRNLKTEIFRCSLEAETLEGRERCCNLVKTLHPTKLLCWVHRREEGETGKIRAHPLCILLLC